MSGDKSIRGRKISLFKRLQPWQKKRKFTGRRDASRKARPGPAERCQLSAYVLIFSISMASHLKKCWSSVTWIKRSWRRGGWRHTTGEGGWKEGKERRWQSVYVFEVSIFFLPFLIQFSFFCRIQKSANYTGCYDIPIQRRQFKWNDKSLGKSDANDKEGDEEKRHSSNCMSRIRDSMARLNAWFLL
jgi:hypothetical protein